jgi:uncharacterized protein
MQMLRREKTTPDYVPDYIAKSIRDIDFDELARKGVRYVAFDADSTLVPYRGVKLAPQTLEFLRRKLKLFDDWCIASNRITHDLDGLALSLKSGMVQAGWMVRKPRKEFYRRVLQHFDNPKPSEVVMIGDKIRADIWGGKRAGLKTVWVEHLGPDNLADRLLGIRRIERKLLSRYL